RDALDPDGRGLDRRAGQPPAAARAARARGAAPLPLGVRRADLRAGRGLPADVGQPRARARRRGVRARPDRRRRPARAAAQGRGAALLGGGRLRGAAHRAARAAAVRGLHQDGRRPLRIL
ncbi:MAG: ATP synthase epsilon chain, partial [uncultured Solirubrobacteraceae bacterium]